MKIKYENFYYEIDDYEGSITAYHKEVNSDNSQDSLEGSDAEEEPNFIEVGKLEIAEFDDTNVLAEVGVNFAYRRKGIGSKMMELAIKHLDLEKIHCSIYSKNNFYLTTDGELLIAGCLKKGIIKPTMCEVDEFYPSLAVNQAIRDYENNPPPAPKEEKPKENRKQFKITDFFKVIPKNNLKRKREEETFNPGEEESFKKSKLDF